MKTSAYWPSLFVGTLFTIAPFVALVQHDADTSSAVTFSVGVLFLVYAVSLLRKKEGRKKCPFCAESINKDANKCRYCGEELVTRFT